MQEGDEVIRRLRVSRAASTIRLAGMIRTILAVLCLGVLLPSLYGPAACLAQQTALPSNYEVVLTEPFARVIRVHYGPHEKVPVHDHPATPTVYVYLNNSGPVRIVHDEAGEPAVVRPPTHKGAFRVSRGMLERHSIENLSDLPSDFLRVELVGSPLGQKELEGRVDAPAELDHLDHLDHDMWRNDYPGLSILRRVCVGSRRCSIEPAPDPSIIVALSDLTLEHRSGKKDTLHLGDVIAVPSQEATMNLSAAGSEPAHLLQLEIATPPAASH